MLAAPASAPVPDSLSQSAAPLAAQPAPSWLDPSALAGSLFDPGALVIVLVGTVLATFARAGLRDMALAARSVSALARKGFDEDANRTAIARWARAIRKRGVLGAESAMPPDAHLARAIKALLRAGSTKALGEVYETTKAQDQGEKARAVRVFEQAGDLAPVFGLVGTLFSMTQLSSIGGNDAIGATMTGASITLGAIATAVLSSLYGVLAAHFVFLPLAHAIARRSQREDEARRALIDWLEDEIIDVVPGASKARVTPLRTPLNKAA